MSSPASSWWEASLAESSGLRGSTETASSRQHPNSLQGWLGLLSLAATLPALSFCEPAPAQPGHHLEVQSISLLCWITRGGKQAVPVQSEAPVQCGCCGVSTRQTRMHRRSEVISHLCWGPALSSRSQHTEARKRASAHTAIRYPHLPETKQTGLSPASPSFFLFKTKS